MVCTRYQGVFDLLSFANSLLLPTVSNAAFNSTKTVKRRSLLLSALCTHWLISIYCGSTLSKAKWTVKAIFHHLSNCLCVFLRFILQLIYTSYLPAFQASRLTLEFLLGYALLYNIRRSGPRTVANYRLLLPPFKKLLKVIGQLLLRRFRSDCRFFVCIYISPCVFNIPNLLSNCPTTIQSSTQLTCS